MAQGSTLRLQQLLAQLGYLPVSFTPATQPTSPQQEADPQSGTFSWRWANQPAALTSLWVPGTYGVITKGAVMSFETSRGSRPTGWPAPRCGPTCWRRRRPGALTPSPTATSGLQDRARDGDRLPERGGGLLTLANTGVPAAPTATGTFPVYAALQGDDHEAAPTPTDRYYVDPGIPWVSYFNGGDALHGFVRGGYGYPQSDGCVEMPPANAAVVWPMTPIGTLVTVR